MMRRTEPKRDRRIPASAAILAGIAGVLVAGLVASPAAGVTNLYAPQLVGTTATELMQFAVAGDGSLSALASATISPGAVDIAVTPDGRFGYVTISAGDTGSILKLVRGAGGRMEPANSFSVVAPFGILVNPQGTRVFYSTSTTLQSRAIDAVTGDLGLPTVLTLDTGVSPAFLAMTAGGTSLYLGDRGTLRSFGPARIRQFSVDLATGATTPTTPAFVDWPAPQPGGTGVPTPASIERMTVTPDGGHLYAASSEGNTGLAHFAIEPFGGTLVSGSVEGAIGGGSTTNVAPVSPNGLDLWSPTTLIRMPPGRIDHFTIGAAGALTPLAGSATYVVDEITRDAVVAPDGRTLYLGQDANVGDWVIAAGTPTSRGNFRAPVNSVRNVGLALAPSQAPVASFTAVPQPAGQATTFNAGASLDPDGSIARYDWNFGDGTLLPNGGPAPTHVYAAAGTFSPTLTVTDADGTSIAQLWTGSRMLRNGGPTARITQPVTIAAAAVPPPPPPAAKAVPEQGRTATIVATTGTVTVKLPGTTFYVDVTLLRAIPLGSTIDARKGRVRVTAEVNATTHETQSSLFYAGIFKITQTKGPPPILVATLVGGSFKGCSPTRVKSSAASHAVGASSAAAGIAGAAAQKKARSKRKVRRLWGRGEGDFRTTGRRSSATVRGTWWLVEDRCDGTLTRVRQGRVDVRDFRLKKTVRLRAGKRSLYLAKAP